MMDASTNPAIAAMAIAGIDFGTSGARIAVIDAATHLVFQASCPFESPDRVQIWQSALFELLGQIPAALRSQLRAIALNGTSSTVLLCDAAGTPMTEPLLYNNPQGRSELPRLRDYFTAQGLHQAPGQDTVLSATSSLVKLLWWQRQPAYAQAHYLMHQADWLAFLLHGQPGISDYHNCLKLGYDVHRLCYPDWLQPLGVLPLLPQVVAPGTGIGCITEEIARRFAIPPTCEICAGTTDSIAAFLASGASAPGEAVTSLGSTLVLKLLSQTPVENGQYGVYSHRLGDRWLVGGASNTGGAVLQRYFSPAELVALSDRLDPRQPSPLDYYPLIRTGERFPINDPTLPPHLEPRPADPVAFLHGLLESMARIEAQGYQRLQELGATPVTQVYTAGGGAKNPAWTGIRARLLGVPVVPSAQTEAAYGSALLALRRLNSRLQAGNSSPGCRP